MFYFANFKFICINLISEDKSLRSVKNKNCGGYPISLSLYIRSKYYFIIINHNKG